MVHDGCGDEAVLRDAARRGGRCVAGAVATGRKMAGSHVVHSQLPPLLPYYYLLYHHPHSFGTMYALETISLSIPPI